MYSGNVKAMFASAVLVAIILAGLLLSLRITSQPREAAPASSSSYYTVTLTNDTAADASFDVFVWQHYTETLKHLGSVSAGASTVFTLPIGGGQYVFRGVAALPEGTGRHDTSITEARLLARGLQINFIADDMGAAALPPEDWPTENPLATPEVIPTPTPEPLVTP